MRAADLDRPWTADPKRTRSTYTAWEKRVDHTRALTGWASCRAQYSRRNSALQAANELAADAAEQAATAAGAYPHVVTLIQLRARCLVAGQLMFDRIRISEYEQSTRGLLLGAGLETPRPRTGLKAFRSAPATRAGAPLRVQETHLMSTTDETIRYTADLGLLADRHVLLIERGWDPFKNRWALTGVH
ncbi:hypothetical protein GCM10023347_07760 [Streptomyces chumphonensis]|uniref:Uncharacterized protein n=1 Tax=Streptomyces chumphonensis TaxID=1214925 RepID=A0A927F656_9ACTN|nr:hypothetical protein [Streptomyces chumphonensis]